MDGLDHLADDHQDTVFRDVILLALAGFVAVVIMLLPHLNPPGKADDDSRTPGNIMVELRWPDEIDADIDLWVEAPGDHPVGYSNKGGVVFNLLRDDLGTQADLTGLNYEVSYSRGIPHGAYTINAHLYRNTSKTYPVPVTIVVSVKRTAQESAKQVLSTEIDLFTQGEERTAIRFEMDDKGHVVFGSVHDLPRKLRSKKS